MNVVGNTSPLIFLAKLAAFDLLAVFNSVSIPSGVLNECKNLELPESIPVIDLGNEARASFYKNLGSLHKGELEAIALAAANKADFVLRDDAKARDFAKTQKLNVMGTIGILLLANKQGLLSLELGRNYLYALKNDHGLYLSESLFKDLNQTFI